MSTDPTETTADDFELIGRLETQADISTRPGQYSELISIANGVRLLNAELDKLRGHILDIDAHATPFGDLPDDPGYVGMYLVTAGALHRALGKIGHTAPSCTAEAERDAARAALARMTRRAESAEELLSLMNMGGGS